MSAKRIEALVTTKFCLFIALCLLFWTLCANPICANPDTFEKTTHPSPTVPQPILELARQQLSYWDNSFAESPSWFDKSLQSKKQFLENWSTLDLDKAMELDRAYSNYRLRLLVMRKLAAHKRWDALAQVSALNPKGAKYVHQFWAQVAELGVAENDLEMIELAGQQVEANAIYEKGSLGAPRRPVLSLRGARFFVAAARLEFYRNQPEEDERSQNEKLGLNELWNVAGGFSPLNSGFGVWVGHHESAPKYSALESWQKLDRELAWMNPAKDPKLAKSIQSLTDSFVYWPQNVSLPRLEDDLSGAWFLRQLEQGRQDVALRYLAIADGSLLDRTCFLAIATPYLGETRDKQAIEWALQCLKKSTGQIPPTDPATPLTSNSKFWLRLEAQAEIASSLKQIGDERGRALALDAVRDFALIANRENLGYNAMTATLRAAALNGLTRSELPESFLDLIDHRLGFHNQIVNQYRLFGRGIYRTVDLSGILQMKEPYRYPQHQEYYRLLEAKKWPEVVFEIEKLAEGNRAWRTSWPKTGARSAAVQGLEKTLQWTREIKNEEARFSVEMGAIEEALKPMRKSIPKYRDTSSPHTIAPSITFPTRGC